MKRILVTIAGIAIFIGIIILYNFSFWIFEGNPKIPRLEGMWWGGYYQSQMFGKQCCVALFKKDNSGRIRIALISSTGQPDIFDVERKSSDKNFVHLNFSKADGMRIEARQLYIGKRYLIQRLMAGRFKDFWKENQHISIRGNFVSVSPPQEFAIEPLTNDDLIKFWRTYVRPEDESVTPERLLNEVGF
jgi:hypothetical protein